MFETVKRSVSHAMSRLCLASDALAASLPCSLFPLPHLCPWPPLKAICPQILVSESAPKGTKLKHTTLTLWWLLQQLLFSRQPSEPTEILSPVHPPPLGFPTWEPQGKMQEPVHKGQLSEYGNNGIRHPRVEDFPDTTSFRTLLQLQGREPDTQIKNGTQRGLKRIYLCLFFLCHLQFWPNWLVQVMWEA